MTGAREVGPAAPRPCSRCPWRTSNQGKRHPGGWYTKANLRRLWAGLRRGERMTCHPTDPDNPVEAEWLEKGVRAAPEGAKTHECTGALILQQREFMRLQRFVQRDPKNGLKLYRWENPRGLTRDGIKAMLQRLAFNGTPLDAMQMATPNLAQPDIGHPDLAPFTREEYLDGQPQ